MHRERASAREPELVASSLEERKERVPVAGGAVAQVRALGERACAPRELAAGPIGVPGVLDQRFVGTRIEVHPLPAGRGRRLTGEAIG